MGKGKSVPSDAHPSIVPGFGPKVVGQDANQRIPFMWLATHEPHFPPLSKTSTLRPH